MILRADALNLPLADASVDLVVTSPPYRARYRCRHHAADLLADLRAARERIADLEGQLAMRGTP